MLPILFAQAQQAPSAPAGGGIMGFLPLILIFIIMYYLLFRPQMKRQKEQQKMQAALKTGDRVVTNAGIHGIISNVKDTTFILKIADNVKIEIEKSSVTAVVKPTETAKAS